MILDTEVLVQCPKSDLILESEPEVLLLSPLALAMSLTLYFTNKASGSASKIRCDFRHWTWAYVKGFS